MIPFIQNSKIAIPETDMSEAVDPKMWEEHRFGLRRKSWESLSNKSFWITGAGTGYGRSLAVALACAGACLYLTGRRREKLLETIEDIKSLNGNTDACHIVEADITDMDQIKSACKKIRTLSDSLYGLVNNAALPPLAGMDNPLQDYPLDEWEGMMRTNVTAPWLLTRESFPHMAKGGAARTLFISSGAGWSFTRGYGPYNVSKAALNTLAGSMAEEYALNYPDVDVQMNVLDPGEAKTEMNQESDINPYAVVKMALTLLSHPKGGPNGRFFHRDGRCLNFTCATPYDKPLI